VRLMCSACQHHGCLTHHSPASHTTSPLPQVVFEEFGFQAFYAAPATTFSLRRMAQLMPTLPAAAAGAGLVVDAGFSFTHVVPYFEGQPILQAGGAHGAQGQCACHKQYSTGQPPAAPSIKEGMPAVLKVARMCC